MKPVLTYNEVFINYLFSFDGYYLDVVALYLQTPYDVVHKPSHGINPEDHCLPDLSCSLIFIPDSYPCFTSTTVPATSGIGTHAT